MNTHTVPPGFRTAGIAAGIKNNAATDLGLIVADEAWPAWAIFTRNYLLGAHIPVCQSHLRTSAGRVRAVLVNSGNANCATGDQGIQDNEHICKALADLIGCPASEILFMSTGAIGARLPVDKIESALPALLAQVHADSIDEFATAIMTTDTHPKVVADTLTTVAGETVQVTGIAKGSGMIHPDMATMLGFLLTDGWSEADLGIGLRAIADESFHRVTIDGDTSPNDTVLLWSSHKHPCQTIQGEHDEKTYPLEEQLTSSSRALSRMIARDGEGASRLVTVQVRGARAVQDTLDVGRFIATSPLVKTAICGRDPNWGRILSAAATSGIPLDIDAAKVWIGEFDLFSNGEPHPENEPAASDYLVANEEVVIGVDLGTGPYHGEVWTCDFTQDYVSINADYRT